jgi:hypothetical protein
MNYLNDIVKIMEPTNEFSIFENILLIKKRDQTIEMELLNNQLVPLKNNLISNHVFRVMKARGLDLIKKENSYEIFDMLDNYELNSFCTICGCNVKSLNNIICCGSENCTKEIMNHVIDDLLTTSYLTDKIVFNFLVTTVYTCMKHPQRDEIFKPFPTFFKSSKDLEEKVTFSYSNINELLKIMEFVKTDYEMYDKIGKYDYSFLKFVFYTNTMSLKSDLLFIEDKNIFNQKKLDNIFDHDEVIAFKVDHDPETENKFRNSSPQYLFHGSSISNWYSILMNGLKVYSGTRMQLHGAAHGRGIYLASTMTYSYSYGFDKYCTSGLGTYGVFQVLKEKKTYLKSGTIYVVPTEGELILRYLIVTKTSGKRAKKLVNMDKYFLEQREHEIKSAELGCIAIRAKRISYDISKLEKLCKQHGFGLTTNISSELELILGKDKTKINIKYSADYPYSPPFIRISETDKKIKSNNILTFGGILNKKLSYKTWQSNTEIYKVIKDVFLDITNITVDNIIYDEAKSYCEYIKTSKTINFY